MWDRVLLARTMLIFTASRKASVMNVAFDHGFCRSIRRSSTTSLHACVCVQQECCDGCPCPFSGAKAMESDDHTVDCPVHTRSGVKEESFQHVTSDVRITASHQSAAAFASSVHASCRLDFLSHHAASYYHYYGPACHVGFLDGTLLRSLHFACTARR